jgi:hypothetical protein
MKTLNLSEFPDYLKTLKPQDWQPILDLIPIIEQTDSFSHYPEVKEVKGVMQMPHIMNAKVVRDFEDLAYSLNLIINFDWSAWDEGHDLANGDIEEIGNLNLLTLCKLITATVRSERFCEGNIAGSFQCGLVLAVLVRIEEIMMKENE